MWRFKVQKHGQHPPLHLVIADSKYVAAGRRLGQFESLSLELQSVRPPPSGSPRGCSTVRSDDCMTCQVAGSEYVMQLSARPYYAMAAWSCATRCCCESLLIDSCTTVERFDRRGNGNVHAQVGSVVTTVQHGRRLGARWHTCVTPRAWAARGVRALAGRAVALRWSNCGETGCH